MSRILAQRQLRMAIQTILAVLTGVETQSPGDWDTPSEQLPELKVRGVNGRKTSIARGPAGYTSVIGIEVLARVGGDTAEAAQDALEALGCTVEDAVMSAPALLQWLQQIATVSSETSITAAGRQHVGEMRWMFDCETFETFERFDVVPEEFVVLQRMLLNIDTIKPFDPGVASASAPSNVISPVASALIVSGSGSAGTYPNPPHPETVLPAPRVSGRDGRLEGVLDLTLPT
jgi:hypothetical protein